MLHMEARSGAVLVESHEEAYVDVEAVVHVWSDMAAEADEAASLVDRGIEQDLHRVIVRAPMLPQTEGWSLWGGKRGSRVDYTVRVPLKCAVRVLAKSGRVHIARTEGRVHLESASGRCSVEDVTGDVTVIARSGSLLIERVRGDVVAEARSGRIEVHTRVRQGDAAVPQRRDGCARYRRRPGCAGAHGLGDHRHRARRCARARAHRDDSLPRQGRRRHGLEDADRAHPPRRRPGAPVLHRRREPDRQRPLRPAAAPRRRISERQRARKCACAPTPAPSA